MPWALTLDNWNPSKAHLSISYRCAFLHPSLIRSIISRIGQNAKRDAKYWKGGVAIYDARTGAAARIDLKRDENWSGRISVTTQNGRAEDLARTINEVMSDVIKDLNLDVEIESEIDLSKDVNWRLPSINMDTPSADPDLIIENTDDQVSNLEFRTPLKAHQDYAVSYAWGDDSETGIKHESEVEGICLRADQIGQRILWDKRDVTFGDSLRDFMDKIGKAHRVLIFLNSRYLLRPNTMNELYTAWVHNGQDAMKFKEATRFFLKDDFSRDNPLLRKSGFDESDSIFKPETWYKCAEYWDEKARIFDTAKNPALLGRSFTHFLNYKHFALSIADIMNLVTDTVHPLSFEDFLEAGFKEDR